MGAYWAKDFLELNGEKGGSYRRLSEEMGKV